MPQAERPKGVGLPNFSSNFFLAHLKGFFYEFEENFDFLAKSYFFQGFIFKEISLIFSCDYASRRSITRHIKKWVNVEETDSKNI